MDAVLSEVIAKMCGTKGGANSSQKTTLHNRCTKPRSSSVGAMDYNVYFMFTKNAPLSLASRPRKVHDGYKDSPPSTKTRQFEPENELSNNGNAVA